MIKFPENFIWGAATASYQIEGAHDKDGKGPSIWDSFTTIPGRILTGDTGNEACDHYNRYKDDVALMKEIGLTHYRFSISWTRILPEGKGKVNKKGIEFYNKLIDELLKNKIIPFVTLYHWDLPLPLQSEEDGWLNKKMGDYFTDYAKICFENFGDRVKDWITFNEPWVVSVLGYGTGLFAPGRKSNTEPYIAAHNLLLAHGKAVKLYRDQFQPKQNGRIAIVNNCDWREPFSDKPEDVEAAQRSVEFYAGWFADPVYKGKYPDSMVERLGDRLPKFTDEESALLKGSTDFFGLNHYSTMIVGNGSAEMQELAFSGNGGVFDDHGVQYSAKPEWELTNMKWPIVPWGCRKLLEWIDERYDHPEIIITENGCSLTDEIKDGAVEDPVRVKFYHDYLSECKKAIDDGVNLTGYFAWSLLDNFEWNHGYSQRFGICYVDYKTQKRIKKASANWYSETIKNNGFSSIK